MNTYLMKKAMIETAVEQGIKLMEEDPKRSVRRLTDLGKQFSKNRFQDMLFSVMQELLNNEDSAYYDMMHNLLNNTDHDALKKFGINFGYMGWTYGADQIRRNERELGCCIPWSLSLCYDPAQTDGITIDRLTQLIQEGQHLGIYVYFIRECEGAADDSYALLELLERYKECAFVWLKGDGRLTAAQIQMLRLCKSTLVSLPLKDDETFLTVTLLREQGIAFAIHSEYDDSVEDGVERAREIDKVLSSQTAFVFLIQKENSLYSAGRYAYDSRMEQQYPFIIADYRADGASLNRILCEQPYALEIASDGTIVLPDMQKGQPFPFDLPLAQALQQVMPAFPVV